MNEETLGCYKDALKRGQKEYRYRVNLGQYPYIQPLSSIREDYYRLQKVNVGLIEIPLFLIVGCVEDSRNNCFSPSFYPLMKPRSEFGGKWENVYKYQVEDGISSPIECYEYLGHFYVKEGNKRVSVLRYVGGTTIWANVTRLMPDDPESDTSKAYAAFLEFYKCAGFYGVYFDEPVKYAMLQSFFGFKPGERWPEEFAKQFRISYMLFRKAFHEMGGRELPLTAADALMVWLPFNSVEAFMTGTTESFHQTLSSMWNEVTSLPDWDNRDIILDTPENTEEKTSLTSLIMGPKRVNVAFLFERNPQTSTWTADHDMGRRHMEEVLGDRVTTQVYYNVTPDEAGEAVIAQAVENGAELIFTNTVQLTMISMRATVKYPKVRIMNCSMGQKSVNMNSYYGRVYEAKFIAGAIAGALSKSDKIGYIATYPILGIPASINAFALGVSLTNPHARVLLKWYSLPGDQLQELQDAGVEYVCNRDTSSVQEQADGLLGLFRFDPEGGMVSVAWPVCKWGEFYIHMVQNFINGLRSYPDKCVTYWWGMNAGVADILLSDDLPAGVRALANILRDGVKNNCISPFSYPMRTQDGTVINDGSRELSLDEIRQMYWLCDLVDGRIPRFDELLPVARSTTELMGIEEEDCLPMAPSADTAGEGEGQ